MIASVTQQATGKSWNVRFVMPSKYTIETLPKPVNPQVVLIEVPATHVAPVRFSGFAGPDSLHQEEVTWVPQPQTFGNLAAKLLRTSQGQMDTLARMRRGGEQVVRHIHVDNRGGQAVIAENVNTGGPKNGKIDNQSAATGAAGIGPALLGTDPFGCGVPIPSSERQAAMQDARRD